MKAVGGRRWALTTKVKKPKDSLKMTGLQYFRVNRGKAAERVENSLDAEFGRLPRSTARWSFNGGKL